MKFDKPTMFGLILNRYKRFFADIELENGEIITAHTPNTGSMKTCWEKGQKALVTFHNDPKRKLQYTLEMIHNKKTWIGINTNWPNKLALEAIENGVIKELQGYEFIKPEFKIGKSRIDLHLSNASGEQCFVEVKNVTMIDNSTAVFPDAVTTRGQKHLEELTKLVKAGHRACMLYVVSRMDCTCFDIARDIDPIYDNLLKTARSAGVEILIYQCELQPDGIEIKSPLPYRQS